MPLAVVLVNTTARGKELGEGSENFVMEVTPDSLVSVMP